jgi:hypothetical protein
MEDFQKEFVPYEIALRMKQLEFDEPCMGCYRLDKMFLFGRTSDNTSTWTLAPLFQQAFRWFREKYNLSVSISLISIDYFYDIRREGEQFIDKPDSYKTYEEAELACLEKLLEIVEENGKDKSET